MSNHKESLKQENEKFNNIFEYDYWNFYSKGKPVKPLKFSNGKSQEDVVKEVVKPIEEDTFEDTEMEIEDFLDWFLVHRFQNPLSTLNEDSWAYREVEVKGEKLTGYLITKPVIGLYKRRNNGSIHSLSDLASAFSGL